MQRMADLRQIRQGETDQEEQDYQRLQRAIDRRIAVQQSFLKERAQESLLQKKGGIEFGLAAQQQAAQAKRDAMQQQYEQSNMYQRAGIAADAAYNQHGYATQRDKQQTQDILKRDTLQHGFMTQRDKQAALDQQNRDERQFGYQTQRDATQQGYTRQNMYQRETADISAKWQEQIQQARNAGMDFSEAQKQDMKVREEAFRKNVLSNPNLDEGQKQQAMTIYQRQLSAIIPNEKVQKPEDGLNQSVIFHEPTQSWFRVGRDSKGFPTYDPLGSGGGGPKPVDPEKQAAEQRNNMLKREETLIKLDKEIRSEIDPETDTPKFKTQDEIDEEKLKRLAPYERFYTDPASPSSLPPHELYQLKAKRDELKAIEKQQRDAKTLNMADSLRLRSGDSEFNPAAQAAYENDPPPKQLPPEQMQDSAAQPAQVPVSSKTIDDQLKQSLTVGDRETAAALKAVKDITAKYKGVPPIGSTERDDLDAAMRFLGAKGYKFDTAKKKRNADFEGALGGWQQ